MLVSGLLLLLLLSSVLLVDIPTATGFELQSLQQPQPQQKQQQSHVFFFSTPEELQQAVDIYLTQDPLNVTNLESVYGPIEAWDVSRITHFDNLFNARTRNPLAASITVDLSLWNVSNAQYMHDMFLDAAMVDFDVSGWKVSKVLHFNGMWEGATSFTGRGLEQWDVSQGRLFMSMFANTRSLSPTVDLRNWNVENAERLTAMFRDSNFGQPTTAAGESDILVQREDAPKPYDLCEWVWKLPPAAQTDGMFAGTFCPDPSDPNLLSRNTVVSFCVPCKDLPPVQNPTDEIIDTTTTIDPEDSSHRPNILFIMADQMRYDMIRAVQDELPQYNNAFKISTPNLDRLKQQGAYFRNVYCQCAVCAPARATLRTGCTIERTGIQHNDLTTEYMNGPLFQDRVEKLQGLDQILVEKLGYVSE
jgi:hypothetical protein